MGYCRSIRLQGYDYSQPGAYFVTMVTHGRECLFGKIDEGEHNPIHLYIEANPAHWGTDEENPGR